MPEVTIAKTGETVEIERANLAGARADFLKQTVRITFDLPLNEETLRLRQQLMVLAASDEYNLRVEITPLQRRML